MSALVDFQRRAERLEQLAIDRIVLRVVFGVPLHAERKAGRVGDADRLDRAVFRHALDHHASSGLVDALTVQRVDADRLATEQPGEDAVRNEPDIVTVGEDHGRIGMDLAVFQPRHAVVHAAGQLADLGMQRAAERDAHLLKAAADAEHRHAALDAGLDQRQRQRITIVVVGLVPGMRFKPEAGGVYVRARAGEQDAVDRVEQRADIGDVRLSGEHQRQRIGDLGDRAQIALAHRLRGKAILDQHAHSR